MQLQCEGSGRSFGMPRPQAAPRSLLKRPQLQEGPMPTGGGPRLSKLASCTAQGGFGADPDCHRTNGPCASASCSLPFAPCQAMCVLAQSILLQTCLIHPARLTRKAWRGPGIAWPAGRYAILRVVRSHGVQGPPPLMQLHRSSVQAQRAEVPWPWKACAGAPCVSC